MDKGRYNNLQVHAKKAKLYWYLKARLFVFSSYPKELNNSWMAADLSHLFSVDEIKHKYEKTVKYLFAFL